MSKLALKHVMFFNTITSWLDRIAVIVMNFVVRPFIILYLGQSMYGVWEMLSKMNSFMATADLRSSSTVKWILARDREIMPNDKLNKTISIGFFANLLTIPIYIVLGTVLIYIAPYITKVEPANYNVVRTVTFIMLLTFVVTQLFFLYEQVLQGMNIAYKRIGVRALITIISGGITYAVLYANFKMVGLAFVQLGTVFVTGITFWFIAKENLKWMKLECVSLKEIWPFMKLSLWFMVDKFSTLLLESLDVILLGYLISSISVSQYVTSSYAMIAILGFLNLFISSIITGISPYAKENNVDKIVHYRRIMWISQLFLVGIIALPVILLNKAFVGLWIDSSLFMGEMNNLLLVVYILLRSISLIDRSLIMMYLRLRIVIINTVISASLLIVSLLILVPKWEISGVFYSLIIGYVAFIILNSNSLSSVLQTNGLFRKLSCYRLSFTLFSVLGISYGLSCCVNVNNWYLFFLYASLSTIIGFVLLFYCGLDAKLRRQIFNFIIKK